MEEPDSAPVNGFTSTFNYDHWLWENDKGVQKSVEYTLFSPDDEIHDWHPVYPQYMNYTRRLRSFDKWPTQLVPTGVELARAGFFYTGYSDEVKCFSCGVELHNWKDKDTAPSEHRRWSKFCRYMKMTHLSN